MQSVTSSYHRVMIFAVVFFLYSDCFISFSALWMTRRREKLAPCFCRNWLHNVCHKKADVLLYRQAKFCKRHTSIFIPLPFSYLNYSKMCKVIDFCFEKMHLIKEGQGLQCKNTIVFLQFSPQRMLKDYNVIKKNQILDSKKEYLNLQN